MKSEPVALMCSDIHLSHIPPIFRSEEPDWYEAMARPLREIEYLSRDLQVPVIIAGDIFDRWHANRTPELINFAIDAFSGWTEIFAVPGQHDLPGHRLDEMHRSAYYTLRQAGCFHDLESTFDHGDLRLHPFPWGAELKPLTEESDKIDIAVIHHFVWVKGHGHTGAPTEDRAIPIKRQLEGHDCLVFGDNHDAFKMQNLVNCGTVMRRKSSEVEYEPRVWALHADGSVRSKPLDTSKDVYLDIQETKVQEQEQEDVEGFADYLKSTANDSGGSLDFRDAVVKFMDGKGVSASVRYLVLASID